MTKYTDSDWNEAAQKSVDIYEKMANDDNSFGAKTTDLTKYFTISLPEKINSGEKTIRLLPFEAGSKELFKLVRFHNLQVGKKWRKLYDPAQDGEESPLNEMYKVLIRGDKEDKKLAYTYKSRDFYIVRCIERGKEEEGVKFWRFPTRDGEGVMDKLNPLIAKLNSKKPGSGAIWRPDASGRDISISIVRDKGKGKNYTKVSQIMFEDPSPLSTDEKQAEEWINDPLTYRDVFRKKPTEFLKLVAQGIEPFWDMENQKFIARPDDDDDNVTDIDGDKELPIPEPMIFTDAVPDVIDNDDDDNDDIPMPTKPSVDVDIDDLPF